MKSDKAMVKFRMVSLSGLGIGKVRRGILRYCYGLVRLS